MGRAKLSAEITAGHDGQDRTCSHTQKPFSVHRALWVQIADVIHGLAGVGGASWGVGVVVVRVARMSLSWSWNVPAVSLNERVSKKTHQAGLRSKA